MRISRLGEHSAGLITPASLLSASTDLMPHEKLAGIGVAAELAGEE